MSVANVKISLEHRNGVHQIPTFYNTDETTVKFMIGFVPRQDVRESVGLLYNRCWTEYLPFSAKAYSRIV